MVARRSATEPSADQGAEADRYSRVEATPYHGNCGACGGWYYRGAATRWHFMDRDRAQREHADCSAARAASPFRRPASPGVPARLAVVERGEVER
jgi:hypothetical protein